ncbi:MAG: hypothetical protein ABI743_14645 [bacterium]
MAKTIGKDVVVQAGGRIEFTVPELPAGTRAHVSIQITTPEERQQIADDLDRLFKRTQEAVAHLGLTEEDIEREIAEVRKLHQCES